MEYLAACGVIAGIYLLNRKKQLSNHSIQVGEKKEGETPIRRNGIHKELVSQSKNCLTLFDSFKHSCEVMPDHPCLGIRNTIAIHKEIQKLPDGTEKPWLYFEKGPYEFISYKDTFQLCRKFANGLRHLGLNPGDKLAIFNDTKLEWTVAEQGCYMQSISILTVYATLGKEGLKYALQEAEITHLFTSGKLIPTLLEVLFECPTLKEVIYTEECAENDLSSLSSHNVNAHSYDAIIKLGEEKEYELTPPSPNDLCCIMYTSGSTGNPKGVMITHQSMMAAVAGYGTIFGVLDDDCYLSYLPLAHVLALVVENAVLHFGAKMGYGTTLTLTDTYMRNCKGDIRELRPTVFAGVPMVYDRIKAGIVAKIQSASFISKFIFHTSLFIKKFYIKNGLKTPLLDMIVFNKFKDLLGGRMRWMVSGGAPLSSGAHLYLRACFGVPLLQGYGLTETCGAGAVMFPIDDSVGTVGPPVPCVEIKLVDVPDMGYTSNDKPNARGEIWMRGPCITSGYFKQPEKTEEVFIDGWFATGDIGLWDNSGKLKIIDRKKNLIKAPTGEYIALEKLESTLKNSKWVSNICVYADSVVTANIAIIFPQLPLVTKWFEDKGIKGDLNNPDLLNDILADLVTTGKKNGLLHFEQITNVILTPNEWTPESGFLTAAMKLQRRNIYHHFDNEIQLILSQKANN